jgi:UDP-glucose 4-epimerase
LKILVTGGAGFIGSHIVDALIEKGHKVVVLDDLSSGSVKNLPRRIRFIKLDVRSNNVGTLFLEENFDAVYHLAAQMDVRKSVADPKFDASVNVLGGLNLLECCAKYNVKKVIFASTGGAIYGEQDYFPADEKHPLRPLSPYGVAKLSFEQYLFYYKEIYGVDYISLRFANIYGPRQNPHGEAGVVAIFTTKFLKGETPVINGDGKQTRDYVYVGDIVDANIRALDHSGTGIFNLGTGIETDVNMLFRQLRDLTGSNCEEIHGPAKKGEQLRSVLDNSLAKDVLGWKPKVSLEQGLKETVDYFKKDR